MVFALALRHATRPDALDRFGKNRIAPHQETPRALVIRLCHFIDAVKVTRAWISMSPGSTGVCAGLSAVRAIVIIGLGGMMPLSRESSMRNTRSMARPAPDDRKSTRLNSSHGYISYAVFCLKKKKKPPCLLSDCL